MNADVPTVGMITNTDKVTGQNYVTVECNVASLSINRSLSFRWKSEEWDADELSSISPSPISKTIYLRVYDFPVVFSILPNSLTVGRSYTFKLEASYDSTFGSEYIGVGEFSTVINEPPTGGQLRVSPTVGETLSVDFVVKTYDWIDSIEDYPLVYFMSSYLLSPDEYTLLKAYSEVSLVTVQQSSCMPKTLWERIQRYPDSE